MEAYVAQGGRREDTEGRRCLCNALTADIGLGQVRAGGQVEPPLVTIGDDLHLLREWLGGRTHYSAVEALDFLVEPAPAGQAVTQGETRGGQTQ